MIRTSLSYLRRLSKYHTRVALSELRWHLRNETLCGARDHNPFHRRVERKPLWRLSEPHHVRLTVHIRQQMLQFLLWRRQQSVNNNISA